MVAFYKHNISAWRGGTSDLSDRAYRVYHVIIEQIMLHEGPIPCHEKSLAGLSNRSTRDFRAAFQELIAAGKLQLIAGKIWNNRAEFELEGIWANRENAAKGGRKVGGRSVNGPRTVGERFVNGAPMVGERHEISNEINGDEQASLNILASLKEESRGDLSSLRSDDASTRSPKPSKARRPKPRTPISEDSQPSEKDRAKANEVRMTDATFRHEWRKFRDYHLREASQMADWSAAWRTWAGGWQDRGSKQFAGPVSGGNTPSTSTEPDWRALVSAYCAGGAWQWSKMSPEPGTPGCKVPADIIGEFSERLPKFFAERSVA